MDTSAFEAADERGSPSLSELAAFFDEDLRLPVKGAVAIVRHLLRLALLVWTLAACVALYCFALAWLCLFWAQTRLFKHTSTFIDGCMSATTVTAEAELINDRIAAPSTEHADAPVALETSSHEQPTAIIIRSGLSAEFEETGRQHKYNASAQVAPCNEETNSLVIDDAETIIRAILQREKEVEAEIQELVDSEHPTSLGTVTPPASDLDIDRLSQVVDTGHECSVATTRSQDGRIGVKTNEYHIVADHSAGNDQKQPEDPNGHDFQDAFNSVPRTATFKMTKTNNKPKPPMLTYAEQVKEKKAREQRLFVEKLTANSIVSTSEHDVRNGGTQAEHLQWVWKEQVVPSPVRNKRLTAITKTVRSQAPSIPSSTAPRTHMHHSQQPTKPIAWNNQNTLTSGASKQPSIYPPHVRSTLEAKARRAAVNQLTYEASVKAKEAVPTHNNFAALTEDTMTKDAPESTRVNGDTSDLAPLVISDAGKAPIQEPLTTLEPARREQVVPDDTATNPEPDQPENLSEASNGQRRVYTAEALKAANIPTITAHVNGIAEKIEAAVELVATHTRSGTASISPKKKKYRTAAKSASRWDNFDGEKEHPPASDRNIQDLQKGNVAVTVPQARLHGAPPGLQDRHDSTISATFDAHLVDAADEAVDRPALDVRDEDQIPAHFSSNIDLVGLEFLQTQASSHTPAPKINLSGPSRSLPITPGPLSFFAPSVAAKESSAAKPPASSEWRSYQESSAFDPFAPGPFQNSYDQAPQQFQQPQFQWTEPDARTSYDNLYMAKQIAPQVTPQIHRHESMGNSPRNDTETFSNRRQSLAVPIRQPSFDVSSEEVFSTLDASNPVKNKIPLGGPPGLGVARSNNRAAFDALLPAVESPPERTLNLGKFISTATTSSAILDKSYGPALGEAEPVVTAVRAQQIPQAAAQNEPLTTTQSTHVGYDATFPELPKVIAPDPQVAAESGEKNAKRENKKLARACLKSAWAEREIARRKLGSFSLEGANNLKQKTILYLEKRSVLQSLMSSGILNQEDARLFPELGLMDMSQPKVFALSAEEWRSRKREAKTTVAEVVNAAPVAVQEQFDETDSIIKDLIIAQRHREQSKDRLKMPRPQGNMTHSTWIDTCTATCARADKLYCRKRKILVDAYPQGLPTELELRFPDISLR